jgi:hypothetical protein
MYPTDAPTTTNPTTTPIADSENPTVSPTAPTASPSQNPTEVTDADKVTSGDGGEVESEEGLGAGGWAILILFFLGVIGGAMLYFYCHAKANQHKKSKRELNDAVVEGAEMDELSSLSDEDADTLTV